VAFGCEANQMKPGTDAAESRKIAERPRFIANDQLLPLSTWLWLGRWRYLMLKHQINRISKVLEILEGCRARFIPLKAAKDELAKLLAAPHN
jgi:hypothetical protein